MRLRVLQRTTEPLLVCDRPYEDFSLAYFNVIREGDEWRLWYTAYDHTYQDDRDSYFCYAASADGVHWTKPSLGLVEFDGSRANNILFKGRGVGGFHGQTVFRDEGAPPEQRYKLVYSSLQGSQWFVLGAVSPNGLRWTFLREPLLPFNSDTQTVCFRDGDIYRLYVRLWTEGDYRGLRTVGYSESPVFGDFPPPVEILRPDSADPPELQFYTSAATRLGAELYLMFPAGFYTKQDVVVPHAATSPDGRSFERVGREPVLPLGTGFDSKGIYVCPGAIAGERPGTWWFYYLGTQVPHDQNAPGKVRSAGGVGRFLLGVDPS